MSFEDAQQPTASSPASFADLTAADCRLLSDVLERIAVRRASEGSEERIAVRRASEGSDVLLIFLLKARRPEVYRDHHRVEHTGPGRGALDMELRLDERAREAIAGVLRQRPAAG